jgi:hypothetical protein
MFASLRQPVECGLPQGPYCDAVTGAIKSRAPLPPAYMISGQQDGGRPVSIHRLTHRLMPRTVHIAKT